MSEPTHFTPRWTLTAMREIAAAPTLSDAAQRYATLGVPVFPCIPGGKQPLTRNGFHDATASPRTVDAWWRRHPDANIGLPTGTRTGVAVVDVDVHPGGSGFAAFERARAGSIAEGWGWLVRTPSGGLHAYYPVSPEAEQRSWQVPSAHVDFRGEGGYVIAPPSLITVDGHPATYSVIAVSHYTPEPIDGQRLRTFLEPPRPAPARAPAWAADRSCNPPALARRVASTPQGGRNHALFWASCRMAESRYGVAEILSWLMPAAQHAGLPDREIESTVSSAFHIASRVGPAPSVSRPCPTRNPVRTTEGIAL